jgi:hypothetical protein
VQNFVHIVGGAPVHGEFVNYVWRWWPAGGRRV